MGKETVREATSKLITSGIMTISETRGCSKEEIRDVEVELNVSLPTIYKEFLATLGKSAGTFLQGSDFLYPEVKTLRNDAERLLEECKATWKFGPSEFVFVGHQGYEFLYFDCDDGEDPPVWRLIEDEDPEEVFPTFTAWLQACVADEIDS